METQPDQVQPESPPAFPVKAWLAWFLVLLLPLAFVVAMIVHFTIGWIELLLDDHWFNYWFFGLLVVFASVFQWIYVRRKVRRGLIWIISQVLIYSLTVFLFYLLFANRLYLLSRILPLSMRLGSICLVLIVFLLPSAIIRFGFFRISKVPADRGWFRDYALVFAVGLVIFLIYDWFTEGRPASIPGGHGALYTGMITFLLCLAGGEAWVLARLRFPPLVPKQKKAKTKITFDYLTASWQSRFLYWFKGLAIPGVFLFFVLIFCFYYTVGLPFPIPFVIFSSCLFFLVEWGLFRKIIKIQYWIFLLSAVCLPLAYWILLSLHIPVGEGFDIYLLVLLIACLLIGIIHHVGLGKLYPRVNILFFTYFLTSIAICLVIIKVISKALLELDNPFYWDIFTVLILVFFPNLIALLLTYFINPQDILLVLDNESNSQEIDLLRKGEEND